MNPLESKLAEYKDKEPEIVFEWSDPHTYAKGWVVINSLKNGAAGGGTRMRKGLTKDEVISLAKVMEIKFTVSGPPIGGAKSGIDFDPQDPRRNEVLKRWYAAVFPLLKNYYGTGGDLNVDELHDVIPITEDLGLWHPQEGIVNGHFGSTKGDKINLIGQLRFGVAKMIEDLDYVPEGNKKYAVADMVTGWGVSESVKHFYQIYKNSTIKDKKVIIQGWGNVASAAGFYLAKLGAKVVGIIDREGGVINEDGLSFEEVTTLFREKRGNQLHYDNLMSFEDVNKRIWDLEADIFIPGAASKLVTRSQVFKLMENGLEVVSCGANVPFIDDKVFFGETASIVDEKIALIPDFIANCGMARVFAYLMQPDVHLTDSALFDDVSLTIKNALQELNKINSDPINLTDTALEYALESVN